MGFWKTYCIRWDRKELKEWGSFKRTAYLLLPLLVYFTVYDIAGILLLMLVDLALRSGGGRMAAFGYENAYTLRGVIYGFAMLAGIGAVWKAVKSEIAPGADGQCKARRGREQASGEGEGGRTGKECSKGKAGSISAKQVTSWCFLAVLAFCASLGLNLFFYLTGLVDASAAFDQVAEIQYGVAFGAGILLYGVVSPLAEEAMFRGILYNRMKRCFNYPIAVIVSSLLFGCYHGNLVQALYGTALGLLLAYVYEMYGSFAAPVLFHGVANISVYSMSHYNWLSGLSREKSILLMAALLAGTGLSFWQVKKDWA